MHAVGITGKASRAALVAGAIALTFGLSGCVLTTPTLAEVERERVEPVLGAADLVNEGHLTVAMNTADAPQAMTDSEGSPAGYYADVARALAEDMGLDLKVVSTANASGAISDGKADIYIGSRLADAGDTLDVTEAIVEDASSIFARAEGDSQAAPQLDAADLSGSVIAVQGDSASQDALMRGGVDASLKTYPNVNKCFEALDAGEVDYVACDATAGAYLARAYPGTVFVATVGPLTSYGVALPAQGSALADAVTGSLAALASSGRLDVIYRHWYGALPMGLGDAELPGLEAQAGDEEDGEFASDDGSMQGGSAYISGATGDGAPSHDSMNSIG